MELFNPFSGTFNSGMGIKPLLHKDATFNCDENYKDQVSLKRELLNHDNYYYFRSKDESQIAEWEVLALVLQSLATRYPEQFKLKVNGRKWEWHNEIFNENVSFTYMEDGSLPYHPMDWAGRQVQEDLLILNSASILVSGQLCFPAGWSLEEKFDRSFLEMHAPLPIAMDSMIEKASQLMGRILIDKPFERMNWGLRLTNKLDLSTRFAREYANLMTEIIPQLTDENFLRNIFLRSEHQTFTRLPLSNHTLFTVHTYIFRLEEVITNYESITSAIHFLSSVPNEVLEYKMIAPFYSQLMNGLRSLAYKINQQF